MTTDPLAEDVRRARASTGLDLEGLTVLAEAATGTYACLAALAALAGARVLLWGRDTRFGTAGEAEEAVRELTRRLGAADRLGPVRTDRPVENLSRADIVTNSGHVRPLDAAAISGMKPTAVLPLMYESWEWRREDVDLAACARLGIAVAGTNEAHPLLRTFESLGDLAARGVKALGVALRGSRLLLVSDCPFGPPMKAGLERLGPSVQWSQDPECDPSGFDAVVLALTPPSSGGRIPAWRPPKGAGPLRIVQVWGDADREGAPAGTAWWPRDPPERGHMGMLLTELEPGVLVRLQSGGLKVGEVLARRRLLGDAPEAAVEAAVRSGWALPPPRATCEVHQA